MKIDKKLLRSIGIGLGIILVVIIFAYGFQVTKVNLEETKSNTRQIQLVRILRTLAKPDILEYQQTEVKVRTNFMVPCPDQGFTPQPTTDTKGPYITVEPACANAGDTVTVNGYNFSPNIGGPLSFIPPSEVTLSLTQFQTDDNGHFQVQVKIPRRDSPEVQNIQAVTRTNVGAPYLSQTAIQTWEKIIETVFMALLATTLGTLLAIPLSFFAAKNLMKDIKSPLIGVALNLILIPVGLYAGIRIASWINDLVSKLATSGWIELAGSVLGLVIFYFAFRWALPPVEEHKVPVGLRIARMVVLAAGIFILAIGLFFVTKLMYRVGDFMEPHLAGFGFLGKFTADIGQIFEVVITLVIGFGVAGFFSSLGGRLGKFVVKKTGKIVKKTLSVLFATIAGAFVVILIMAALNWFYQFNNVAIQYIWPGIVGGIIGLVLAFRVPPEGDMPIGIAIYYISRTIWNAVRSIEALVWVIIFVVWVGIGPFAGVIALSLHTIAALAKLYSEQVESILPGPMEAITATGANRIQTVVYAVIPQIIPPYISFTMYRWDINVRMSTIIGFAGGGGIGFLLYQNINLLNYRGASAQMLAIAIVVASMDYLSSKLREKLV